MKRIATFDLETDGLLDDVTKVWCAVVRDHNSGSITEFYLDSVEQLCVFLDTFDVLIGHNSIYFDFPVLRKLYGWEYEGTKVDTLIMSRTQRPYRKKPPNCSGGPHSVEAWGIRLRNHKIDNTVWGHFHSKILERCRQDVEIQYEIFQALLLEGKGEGWRNAHILNQELFPLLQRQEEYGWLVDREKIDVNIHILKAWIKRIDMAIDDRIPLVVDVLETKKAGEYNYVRKPFKKDGELTKNMSSYLRDSDDGVRDGICGPLSRVEFRPVDLNSNKEVKEFLLGIGWQPDEFNVNDEGKITSAKLSKNDSFRGIQGGLGKLIAKRVQCRHRLSTLEGWLERIRPDGRIGAKVAGAAATGRLRHNVIVNVPSPHSGSFFARQMREVFVAKPGWVLVGVDSVVNQVRQLAARMGDPAFT